MSSDGGQGRIVTDAGAADGLSLRRVIGPSRLYGANGLRTGADGRIYVAQVAGSQVSAIDIDSGSIEVISPMGGDIVGPDDLAFDESGNMFATELTEGRVSMLDANGRYRVIQGDMPCANPITMHQGHLYAGECRPDGRIMELDLHGGAPRTILENVPMPNAFEIGPDGLLYFPVMGANEIWRVDPAGGTPEVVARDLGVPDSVKFDADGYIVSTQVASGQVLRIDPQTGNKTILAQLTPGLDNCTFVGNRLFVSCMTGQIVEILGPGEIRPVIPQGLQWPMGLAVNEAGTLYIADGGFGYTLPPAGEMSLEGMLFTPGYPGFTRGVTAGVQGEWIVTTANGDVARYRPASQESEVLAAGYDRLMGVDTSSRGTVVFAEYGTGRVFACDGSAVSELARGLARPVGVAVASPETCYVAESAGGRIVRISGSKVETVLDGLRQPEGIALHGDKLYVIDAAAKELVELDTASGKRRLVACNLPVGGPPGGERKQLGAVGVLAGPMTAFTGLAAGADGTLYIAGDGDGSVIAVALSEGPD